jgi:hypothetical protein
MSNAVVRTRRRRSVPDEKLPNAWVDRELADCEFKDERLGKRFRSLLERLASSPGDSIPLVCQDWANTKAAYRFLDNDRVSEAEILAGHFHATRDRVAATSGPILVLHDTTEFSYKRDNIEAIGKTFLGVAGVDLEGRPRHYTACGILMHSTLAVTTDGLPLGLTAIKFWSREKFKGTNALKKRINPTRVPIEEKESVRWLDNLRQSTTLLERAASCVHIGDRESDIYEFFCTAKDVGTHFLLRTCVDRLAAEMAETRCKGVHRVEVRDRHGEFSHATLELKFRRIKVLPPIGKQSRYPTLDLTVLHATERGKPRGRDRIDWKLVTDLPITSRTEAIEKLNWYAQRWKIGVPQDPEVRLPRRTIETTDGRAPRQPAGDILHPQLAYLLDDDAQSIYSQSEAHAGVHATGDRAPETTDSRTYQPRFPPQTIAKLLPDAAGSPGRLPEPCG